jgi:arabinofuranosyltransferase
MQFEIPRIFRERFQLLLIITIAGLVLLAWLNRFVQDDAFISFRYADNFAHGHGLVWNIGERVEGYTNFLWTLLIGGGIFIGIDPIDCSFMLGILSLIFTLIFTYKLTFLFFKSEYIGLLTILLLGTNHSFSSYATGGLETQMQTALFITSCYVCVKCMISNKWTTGSLLSLSILLTASILMRLDSALLGLVVWIFSMINLLKEKNTIRQKVNKIFIFTAPIILVVGAWFLWKLYYYGDILPNTYYLKASAITSPSRGLNYIYVFLASYLLFPFIIIGIFAARAFFRKFQLSLFLLGVVVFLWLAYITKIGGDFMEFRFFVPILPMVFIILSWIIFIYIQKPIIRTALVLLIAAGTIYHTLTFVLDPVDGIEPIRDLLGHIISDHQNWLGIGKVLGRIFSNNTDVTIATTAAGAIPYFSHLSAVDMLGINDERVAHDGFVIGSKPGHQRMSTFGYLRERKVNLVISHPYVTELASPIPHFPKMPLNPNDYIYDTKVIEIPLDSMYKFVALYLTPNSDIDQIIKVNHWKVHAFAMR